MPGSTRRFATAESGAAPASGAHGGAVVAEPAVPVRLSALVPIATDPSTTLPARSSRQQQALGRVTGPAWAALVLLVLVVGCAVGIISATRPRTRMRRAARPPRTSPRSDANGTRWCVAWSTGSARWSRETA